MKATNCRLVISIAGFVILAVLLGDLTAASQADQSRMLLQAYENGKLDREQYYLYLLQTVFEPERIPSEFSLDIDSPMKCGTPILLEIREQWGSFSEEFHATASSMFIRPNTQFQFVSPGGFFKLHYDTLSGMETPPVPTEDLDLDSIPDFIENIADYADSSWRQLVHNFGYVKPPTDGTLGGDSLYDIYFNQFQYYGVTNGDFAGDSAWDDWVSHIILHRNFDSPGFGPNQDPEGYLKGRMKVAIAHELYHAIQFYYDGYLADWWAEQTAVWMEDEVFPGIHDNYNYFDYFWPAPELSLMDVDAPLHMYGTFVWPKLLTQHADYGIIKSVLEGMAYPSSSLMTVLQNTLIAFGTSFDAEFTEFLYWNYMSGSRDDGLHYIDGADYPGIAVMRSHSVVPAFEQASHAAPYSRGSNYIEVTNDSNYIGILAFAFDTAYSAPWGLASIAIDTAGECRYSQAYVAPVGVGTTYVSYFEDHQSAVFIPYVKGTAVSGPYGMLYDLYFRPMGDADNTGEIDIDDVVWIVDYIFAGGPASNPAAAMDADCSREIDIDDVVYLVLFIFSGGPAPCGEGQ